jgi:uncharacterized protein YlzI (FlbEa/FlbD family)
MWLIFTATLLRKAMTAGGAEWIKKCAGSIPPFRTILLGVWIILTGPNGSKVYLNTDGPQWIGKTQRGISLGNTEIILSGGNQIYVMETPEEVMKKFREAKVGEQLSSTTTN